MKKTTGTKFLMATLVDGTKVVGQFEQLGGSGQGYAEQVMRGVKAFNAWRVVGTNHPASGEPCLLRIREMIAGSRIQSIQQVHPTVSNHNYAWTNFQPVVELQKGQYGNWTAPSVGAPEGVVAGMDYPVHRDPADGRRYVIVKVAGEPETVGGEPVPEQRYYVDATTLAPVVDRDDATADDDDEEDGGYVGRGPTDADDDIE